MQNINYKEILGLLNYSPASVIITNTEGKIEYVNSRFTKISGYTIDEVLERDIRSLRFAETNPEMFHQIWSTISSGNEWNGEFLNYKKNGEQFWEVASVFMLKDEDGNIKHFAVAGEDITKQKCTEKELEIYKRHLEELITERIQELSKINGELKQKIEKQKEIEKRIRKSLEQEIEFSELKSKYASMASHEFKTFLAIVYSSAEVFQRYGQKLNKQELDELVENIKKYVQHMNAVIDDMLIVSKTETSEIKFDPAVIDLEELCLIILEELKLLHKKDYNMQFNYYAKQKSFFMDEKLLRYVLLNLLSNAVKYSGDNCSIVLNVKLNGKNIVFEIIDNGIGISEKDKFSLFEPFYRGENVGDIQGTGLGMTIVKKSVELHGGSITFESKINEGTKFTVNIPLH